MCRLSVVAEDDVLIKEVIPTCGNDYCYGSAQDKVFVREEAHDKNREEVIYRDKYSVPDCLLGYGLYFFLIILECYQLL